MVTKHDPSSVSLRRFRPLRFGWYHVCWRWASCSSFAICTCLCWVDLTAGWWRGCKTYWKVGELTCCKPSALHRLAICGFEMVSAAFSSFQQLSGTLHLSIWGYIIVVVLALLTLGLDWVYACLWLHVLQLLAVTSSFFHLLSSSAVRVNGSCNSWAANEGNIPPQSSPKALGKWWP